MKRLLALAWLLGACGVPPLPGTPLPLVVVLHGYGGTPKSVTHILDGLAVHARIFAPHGDKATLSGWSWFSSPERSSEEEFERGLRHATESLAQQIAEVEKKRPTCGKPIVLGFSQGGFLSYALAARPLPVVGLALPISGYLPPPLFPTKQPEHPPTVIAFHGEADQRVDLASDRATHDAFTSAGYTASVRTFPRVGHAMSHDELEDIRAAIVDYVKAEGCAQ